MVTSSRNKSATGFGLHRVNSKPGGEKSVEKRQSQHNSFLNDQSLINEQQFQSTTKKLQSCRSQVAFASSLHNRQTPSSTQQELSRPRSNNGSVGPLAKHLPPSMQQQAGAKVNNYLTIDVSGATPAAATAAISITQGGQTNREA